MAREKTLELFRLVCEKPGMYVQRADFAAVSAYLDGYDAALQGRALVGFREWLLESNPRTSQRGSRWT